MGFPCTYPQAVVFSPTTHGGIGSINLRIEQGIVIVIEVMRTLRTPSHGQNILRIFLRTKQHASGLSKPLLEYPDLWAPHLEGDYYVYLRKFLVEHKIQLECACVKRPELERENDKFLMDVACAKSKEDLGEVDIKTINYYRCYVEVQRMSDICTADGHYILQSVMDGQRSGSQSQSRLEEIIQERPENKEWRVWRRFLRQYCHEGSNRLTNSLGSK